MSRTAVWCGADRLLSDTSRLAELKARSVGVLANPTSVTRSFLHLVDALCAEGVTPTRLFGPEHGLRGEAQDMIAVDEGRDPITGLPTVSLYGDTFDSLKPTPGQLADIDLMIIDIQDVGARYYTYVYTAMLTAEACTEAGVDVLILDRPNPITSRVEGPPVLPGFDSFVGMLPLPNRHGLTLAEVLRFAKNSGRRLTFDVIAASGWTPSLWFDQTNAPWVLPSPNMPTLDTALVYPGMCLLEGTELSEGRGTTRPFELFGAPFIDAARLAKILESLPLPGVRFRQVSFEPTFQKWARQRCSGLQLHVIDRNVFDSTSTGAAIVWACARLFDAFEWRTKAYEFVQNVPAIDLLFGAAEPRALIEEGAPFEALSECLRTPAALRQELDAARMYRE